MNLLILWCILLCQMNGLLSMPVQELQDLIGSVRTEILLSNSPHEFKLTNRTGYYVPYDC